MRLVDVDLPNDDASRALMFQSFLFWMRLVDPPRAKHHRRFTQVSIFFFLVVLFSSLLCYTCLFILWGFSFFVFVDEVCRPPRRNDPAGRFRCFNPCCSG